MRLAMLPTRFHIAGILSAALSLMLMAPAALAGEQGSTYLPQFQLHLDNNARQSLLTRDQELKDNLLQPSLANLDPTGERVRTGNALQQYDARLFYPVSNIHGMSLDLGVNIKYLNAINYDDGLDGVHNFSQAIPMFYATALFDLPFDGLSASLEGSHRNDQFARAFDYQAKLQYKWNRSLGLEGGWRHQQYSLDNGQSLPGLEYESKGVFVDLFMDF